MRKLLSPLKKSPAYIIYAVVISILMLALPQSGRAQSTFMFPGTQAQTAPIPVVSGNNYPKAGDTAVVANQAVINDFVNHTNLLDSFYIKNQITFRINEALPRILTKPFSAVLTYKIYFTDRSGLTYDSVRSNLSLTINYDTAKAAVYKTSNSLVFYNGYKVKVKILSLSTTDTSLLKALEVDNTMIYRNYYKFDCTNSAVTVLNIVQPTGPNPDELVVTWPAKLGVSGYDLEWTYVDSSSILANKYASFDAAMLNNATRVNLTDTFTSYAIPLLFEKQGALGIRLRTVQDLPNNRRMESDWKASATFGFSGHQTNLNWQSSVSFAEEGKRKAVVQYYDGSLRNRQTVTKDNTTKTTVVAETMYDGQGRPTIQVLPSPTIKTVIQYNTRFNSINGAEYDKTRYDRQIASYTCGSGADAMTTDSGASRYYSPNNPEKTIAFNQYIPNAFGYPYSETRYMQDNTGRLVSQSGVGKAFQLGMGHETKYYYSTPDQNELDALFGTEVGYASHYFKNYVRDANGQYSVTYLDMHGRTIATALAGSLPDSTKMDILSEKGADSTLIKTITDSTNNFAKELSLESSKDLVITKPEKDTFFYTLPASTLSIKDCVGNPVSYPCKYDLTITITDNCNNNTLPGSVPYVYTATNIASASAVKFWLDLKEAVYSVTKKLVINQATLENYRDSLFLAKNRCRSIAQLTTTYIDSFKISHNGCGVPQDCNACATSLGTLATFRTNLITQNGWNPAAITVSMDSTISAEYNRQKDACASLCPKPANRLDQIYNDMMSDISPGGQYANPGNIDTWSIFAPDPANGNVIRFKNTSYRYLDANGNLDFIYVNGKPVLPQTLSNTDFLLNFKPSWAAALVVAHPEYPRWQYAVTNVTRGSFYYEYDFNNTTTFRAAYTKGYLNPTGNSTYVNKFTSMSFPIGAPPMKDSFFVKNSTQKTAMEGKMVQYAKWNSVDTFSIWGAASTGGYCNANDQACATQNKKFPFADTTTCKGGADMGWMAFRALYSAAKDSMVWLFINTNSTVAAALNTAFTNGTHTSRFTYNASKKIMDSIPGVTTGTVTSASLAASKLAIATLMRAQFRSNCAAYASVWWNQLSVCTTVKLRSDSVSLLNDLINVCQKGSDQSHPQGSSTISPDSVNDYQSFDDVLQRHIQIYNQAHPDSMINTGVCNAGLLLFPRPYSAPTTVMNKPIYGKPDSCDCSQITKLKAAYQSVSTKYTSYADYLKKVLNITMTDADLNLLLARCANTPGTCVNSSTPISLPPGLQCGASAVCGTCDLVQAADYEFHYTYPALTPVNLVAPSDSLQALSNKIYEQFMNGRLSLYRSASEYLTFIGQCGVVTAGLTDSLQKLLRSFSIGDAAGHAPQITFNTQEGFLYHDMHQLAFNGVLHLPDSVRRLPNNWFNNFQINTSGGLCLDSGYSVEWRTKFLTDIVPYTIQGNYSYTLTGDESFVFDRYATSFTIGATQYPAGLYVSAYSNPTKGGTISAPYTLITPDYNALTNWCTLKIKMTRNSYTIYFNGATIGSYPRIDSTSGLTYRSLFELGLFGRQGAFDWMKIYDKDGVTRYFEDFNNPDVPAQVDRNFFCPGFATSCQQDFVTYFNTQRGTAYTYAQVDSLYMKAVGIHPNVCGINPSDTCANFTYARTYYSGGADTIKDGKQTLDGGYIMAGKTTGGHGGSDAYLIRTDKKGNLLWSKNYGGAGDDCFNKVALTMDGGFIAVGTSKSFYQAAGEIYVTRVNGNGDIVWSRTFGQNNAYGQEGVDIVSTPADSGFAIVGTTQAYENVYQTWFIAKLDKLGRENWVINRTSEYIDWIKGIIEDQDTLVVIGASLQHYWNDVLIYKISRSTGQIYWQKTYDLESMNNMPIAISKCKNGYRIVVQESTDRSQNNTANLLMEIDQNGIIQWMKKLPKAGGGASMRWGSGSTTADNGFILAQSDSTNTADIYLHKLDSVGNMVWTNRVRRTGAQLLYGLIVNTDNSFTGFGYDGNKALLLKTDKNGKTGLSDTAYSYSTTAVTDTVNSDWGLEYDLGGYSLDTTIAQTAINGYPLRTLIANKDACKSPYLPTGLTLCPSNGGYPLPSIPTIITGACADSSNWAASMATNVYTVTTDSLKGSFEQAYLGLCFQVARSESLQVRQGISEYHYTLYYYDQAGNLVKTVPPSGVVKNYNATFLSQVKTARRNGTAQLPAHYLSTNYRYNSLNAVVAQFTPDMRKSYFWYDRLGRLVLSQNAKQASEGVNYSYTLYDALGRVNEVGQINAGVGAVTTSSTKSATQWQTWLTNNSTNRYQITNTFYDVSASGISLWLKQNTSTLRNRVSYSTITPGQIGVQPIYATYYNYDIAGNVANLLQDFAAGSPMGLSGQQFKKVDYSYDLISGKVNSVAYQQGKPDAFLHFYQYDAENRIIDVYSSADSITIEHEAHYTYYKHGPLARTLIGTNQVQGMDYAYTLQGWLKSVNGTALNPIYDMGQDGNTAIQALQYIGRDAFGFSLQYYDSDYVAINNTSFLNGNKPKLVAVGAAYRGLYNGNISSMAVNISAFPTPVLYNYSYDQLNRLTGMDMLNGTNTGQNLWSNGLTATADYKERVVYDPNGNIKNYLRNGYGATPVMDSMTYRYNLDAQGRILNNRLDHIRDLVNGVNNSSNYPNDIDDQAVGTYAYDSIGNLTKDGQFAVSGVTWSVYGKMLGLTKGSNTITYQYDATGNRIGKTSSGTNTWYVRDAQGNVLTVYSGSSMTMQERDIYGTSRLGTIGNPTAMTLTAQLMDGLGSGTYYDFTRGIKVFELTNQLGNTLTTISDKKFGSPVSGMPTQASYYTADVKTAQDYYPFGMEMLGRQFNATTYMYTFNGKRDDKDAEYGWQDYGMREYDKRRAQFISVDPLYKKYPELTPYQFASNSPIGGIDLDGLEFLSSFTSAQKSKFEGEIILKNTYKGPTVSSYDPSNKSFTQSWRDSKNFIATITYKVANGLYTFPQQLTADMRNVNFVFNLGGNAYHARSLEDEKERVANFSDFVGAILPGAPVEARASELFSLSLRKIGWTGKIGENILKQLGGQSQKYFETSLGARFIDQFANGIAYESKVGYTSLTKSVQLQIEKDVELMSTNPSVKKVVWKFFESPETGKAGASKPLLEALKKAGIETEIVKPK